MVPRILVAVGDPAIAELVAAVLGDDGYAVLRADAGAPTLAAVRREGYDLLVATDLMARIDDVLLIRYLRDYPGLALPLILLAPARPFPCPPTAPSSPSRSTSTR
jgi:CheY-like chemotaxis protein